MLNGDNYKVGKIEITQYGKVPPPSPSPPQPNPLDVAYIIMFGAVNLVLMLLVLFWIVR